MKSAEQHGNTSPVNLTRRIKRHAWAPAWDWFTVCAPGLEKLCAGELAALGLEVSSSQPGGVPFRGKLEAAYRANLWMRSGARVLLRLADFRVRNWSDLTRQAGRAPWEFFLAPGAKVKVQVTLRQSNLKHTGRIAEQVLDQARDRMEGLGLAGPSASSGPGEDVQMVQVRGVDRRASISIDSSGTHLHKRGYRLASGQAPLREDLAAALLIFCGYQGKTPLLDPMCGSGTLGIEAALMARGLPPALERGLAMETWPCHRDQAWEHMHKMAREQSLSRPEAPIFIRDKRIQAVRQAEDNAARASVDQDLDLASADFLTASPPDCPPGLLVVNPPYGKRLGSVRQAREFMKKVGAKLSRDYQGWQAGVVLYRPEWAGLLGLHQTDSLVVPHGGLKISLLKGQVISKD